jgi:hypothetical protein
MSFEFHQATRCYIPEDTTLTDFFVAVCYLVGYSSLNRSPVITNLVQESERVNYIYRLLFILHNVKQIMLEYLEIPLLFYRSINQKQLKTTEI